MFDSPSCVFAIVGGKRQAAVKTKCGLSHMSSLSKSLPYSSKHGISSPPRPSTARSSRSRERLSPILKSARRSPSPRNESSRSVQFDDVPTGWKTSESPDEWFCRIMRSKQLCPQDLADIFAYGDASKHRKVPLSHICEVMFDLDPQQTTQSGPVSERMEEFLYEHSYEDCGDIVVDIKQALRALDIWGLEHRGSPTSSKSPTKSSISSRGKEARLGTKSQNRFGVVTGPRSENMRISYEFQDAQDSYTEFATDKRNHSYNGSVPTSPSKTSKQPYPGADDELVAIANELTYTGVKDLEVQLAQLDKSASGFVSLKQLRWLLADHFSIDISETRLLEICIGMNFNPQAQIDYREFITALLDLLIYSVRDMAPSGRNNMLTRLDNYMSSGFSPDRSKTRKLLEQLCRKYDLESDGCITLVEFLRVLHRDLVEEHALHLAFPLSEKETIQLLLSSSARPTELSTAKDNSTAAFLYYDEVLDALLGGEILDEGDAGKSRSSQAYSSSFWEIIRKTLCNGSRSKEASVLAQIIKIVRKLDRDQTFIISSLFFKRIFDQHLRSEDLYIICRALRFDGGDGGQRQTLRYDVFLYLTFGEPHITANNQDSLWTSICSKVKKSERILRTNVTDIMRVNGADWLLGLQAFCELIDKSTEHEALLPVEQLYIFCILTSPGKRVTEVEIKTLWSFLVRDCWEDEDGIWGTRKHLRQEPTLLTETQADIKSLRDQIVGCLADYNLEEALTTSVVHHRAWIGRTKLAAELVKMLRSTGYSDRYRSEKHMIRALNDYLKHIAEQSSTRTGDSSENPPFPDAISLDAFFTSLFDWRALIQEMKLPENLVEVNKHLQLFDWDKTGSIRCDDWNKAWRQICVGLPGMYDWQIRVMQRQFPGANTEKQVRSLAKANSLWSETINYSRLLVYLLDLQQQQARSELLCLIQSTIHRETATSTGKMSTFRLEKLFRSIDRDDKGYINALDLVSYLPQHVDSVNNIGIKKLLENADAVAFVMRTLSGENIPGLKSRAPRNQDGTPGDKAPVISFSCFRCIVSELSSTPSPSHIATQPFQRGTEVSPTASPHKSIVLSLRSLELTILEISRQISGLGDQIMPLRAFQHFLTGSSTAKSPPRLSPTKSPIKRSRRDDLSSPIKARQREVEASTDPLTAEKLKQTLQRYHQVTASTLLINQFFQHIGSSSKQFLDLVTFARWAAPLSIDMEAKARVIVKKIVVKGKGGGGKVDLDRFVAQLERRLMDSPMYSSRNANTSFASYEGSTRSLPRLVPSSLLLTKLHQLNIPLGRNDMTMLLRHFGMDEGDEYVDHVLFLQRLYESTALVRNQ